MVGIIITSLKQNNIARHCLDTSFFIIAYPPPPHTNYTKTINPKNTTELVYSEKYKIIDVKTDLIVIIFITPN